MQKNNEMSHDFFCVFRRGIQAALLIAITRYIAFQFCVLSSEGTISIFLSVWYLRIIRDYNVEEPGINGNPQNSVTFQRKRALRTNPRNNFS